MFLLLQKDVPDQHPEAQASLTSYSSHCHYQEQSLFFQEGGDKGGDEGGHCQAQQGGVHLLAGGE